VVLAAGLVGVIGCGGRTTHQVSGKVQYTDGSPISGGARVIRLEPTSDTTAEIRKVASGVIEQDGSFELFTQRPGDGVIAGKYKVTFTVMDKPMGGKSLIPLKYTTEDQTPFELVVDDDKTGLTYELEKQ
jgi:hypothetical protein